MRNKKYSKIALASALIATIGVGGCFPRNENRAKINEERTIENYERAAHHLESEIRKIAVYGPLDMRYGDFLKATGIERSLPRGADDLTVWVDVVPEHSYDYTRKRTIEQRIMKDSNNSRGRVRIDIPYNDAVKVKADLTKYQNEFLGILLE